LRELVARSCRVLGKLNLTKEPSWPRQRAGARYGQNSHQSARTGRIWTPRFVTAEDIITVDMAGKKVEGPDGLETPQEVFIHTWLYRTRPRSNPCSRASADRSAVYDLQQTSVTAVRRLRSEQPAPMMEGLASYPRSITVSNEKLGAEFAEAMSGKAACLMRGHGITTAGAEVEEATLPRSSSRIGRGELPGIPSGQT